jgi:hypothetical protein
MSAGAAFRATEYGSGNAEAVALVAGFAGETLQLDVAARSLAAIGRDTVLYTYHPDVLLAGDPDQLPQLAASLGEDFQARTADHIRRRFGGVSLGGAIASNMQKECPNPEPGVYAATGTDAADLVMRDALFRAIVLVTHRTDVRKAFTSKGHTIDDLREAWSEIHTPPATAFSLALGGLDRIVKYRHMRAKVAAWQEGNPSIRTHVLPRLGHNATIRWFNNNCASLIGV